jgi:hypothetical protein
MKNIIYFGKSLLVIVIPIVFAIVSAIVVSALFSFVGVLMGHNTFVSCFQNMLGDVTFVMSVITLFLWIVYLVQDSES